MTKMFRTDTLDMVSIINGLKKSVRLWLDEMEKGLTPGWSHCYRSRCSDMHGTVMFTWACAIALELLIRERLGWRISYP